MSEITMNKAEAEYWQERAIMAEIQVKKLRDTIKAAYEERNDWVWVYTFERCEKPGGWPEIDSRPLNSKSVGNNG